MAVETNGNGNGHGHRGAAHEAVRTVTATNGTAPVGATPLESALSLAGALAKLPARIGRAATNAIGTRIPAADLDERDPDYIRESLPRLWLLASLYFRAEVRGLGNIP